MIRSDVQIPMLHSREWQKNPNNNSNNLNKLGFLNVLEFLDKLSNLPVMHASNKHVRAPIYPQ